jgi:type I restriction enzyme M protein
VKPSLVFLKKFTEQEEQEYKDISEKAEKEMNLEFSEELENSEKKLKNTKKADEKKKLKSEIKELKNKIEEKIKKKIKENFNYTIPIAEVEKA